MNQSSPTPTDRSMDRISAIETSLRAFVYGILGLLPLIGLVPAVLALSSSVRIRTHFGRQWNPASAYLTGAVILAVLGIIQTFIIFFCLAAALYLNLCS